MKLRTFFLTWLGQQPLEQRYEIEMQRFFKISERRYVVEVLAKLKSLYPQLNKQLEDFALLEQKRFYIIDTFSYTEEDVREPIEKAIAFCSATEQEQRNFKFKVNPKLSEFLIQTKFQWYGPEIDVLSAEKGNFLFAPSILGLPPKELVLDGLNTLLLDLKDYSASFTYGEFFNLVKQAIVMEETVLDQLLLEFIREQVLYYRSLFPLE